MGYLLDFLKLYNKAALAMPSNEGFDYTKNLGREGCTNAYPGVETYYEANIAFNPIGMVPQYIAQRVKYAVQCGLWKRWESLF